MSKTISVELKTHLAQETTSITTCILMKLAWRQIPVADITQANPAVVTTEYDHNLVTGQYICFDGVEGMIELNEDPHTTPWNFFQVNVTGDKEFELIGVNSTGYAAYTAGGAISELVSFTDNTSPIELDGIIYDPSTGFTKSAVSTDNTMAVDTIDLTGIIGTIGGGMEITQGDVIAGRFDMAEIRVFQVNYEDLTMERMWLKRGWIGQVTVQDLIYTAEVRGMAQMLQVQTLELYSAGCRYDLGSSRCGFDLVNGTLQDSSPATITGAVTHIIDNKSFKDTNRLETEDDDFKYGMITWTTGLNSGLKKEVEGYTFISSTIDLVDAMPFSIQVGDEYIMNKGCDKSTEVTGCKKFYPDLKKFGGFPHLPGEDILLRVIIPKQSTTQ